MKEFRDLMTKYCGLTFVACEIGTGGYTTDGSLVTGAWWTFVMTQCDKIEILFFLYCATVRFQLF